MVNFGVSARSENVMKTMSGSRFAHQMSSPAGAWLVAKVMIRSTTVLNAAGDGYYF